jgi:uncharacterized Zn-finger protein
MSKVKSVRSSAGAKSSPLETLHVNSKKVSCSGSGVVSGHPLVYLEMGKDDFVICPYCSKFFTIKEKRKILGTKNK